MMQELFEVYRAGSEEGEAESVFFSEMAAITFILCDLPSDDFWYVVVNEGQYTAVIHQGRVWRPETESRGPLFPSGKAAVKWLREEVFAAQGAS